jgi:hypothetical protein
MRKERGLRVARVRVQDVTNNEQMRAGHQDYVAWHPEDARALGIKESSSLTRDQLVVVALGKNERASAFSMKS